MNIAARRLRDRVFESVSKSESGELGLGRSKKMSKKAQKGPIRPILCPAALRAHKECLAVLIFVKKFAHQVNRARIRSEPT